MPGFVSLHNHTKYSIYDSLVSPEDLIKTTKDLGQNSIAITDHCTLASIWESLQCAKKYNVKLITGCELNFVDELSETAKIRHLLVIAKNAKGYENLLNLCATGYDNMIVSNRKVIPRIDWKALETFSSNLIVSTACGNGILSQLISMGKFDEAIDNAKRLKEMFGENFFIEFQPYGLRRRKTRFSELMDQNFISRKLREISSSLNIKPIITANTHYLKKNQADDHDSILALAASETKKGISRLSYKFNDEDYVDLSVESTAFIENKALKMFRDEKFVSEALDNTMLISDLCEGSPWVDPKYSNPTGKELPLFDVSQQDDLQEFTEWVNKPNRFNAPNKEQDELYLRYMCDKGLNKITLFKPLEEYITRVEEELEVLEFHKFSSYMLIVMDYIQWAKSQGYMVGVGRGSAGGSLIGYLTGIHIADPLKYDLIFARFINKEKTSFPDIDSDFESNGKEAVQKYILQKYGVDNVAGVSNINTMSPKVYAKNIARLMEFGGSRSVAAKIGQEIADTIPKKNSKDEEVKHVSDALEQFPLFSLYADKYPSLRDYALTLDKLPTTFSTHAGGTVIGKRKLRGLVPLRRDAERNIALEYDKDDAELNGLVKMDILGLETLVIIAQTYKLIEQAGKTVPPNIYDFNFDTYDEKTYNLISSGNTFKVFQLGTSAGTIELCKKVKPKCIEDIAIINALARPSSKTIRQAYIDTRNGVKPVSLIHPACERAFGPTLGFGLYEESLMYLAADVAGWNLHQADALRKLTKEKGKNPEKAAKLRQTFIDGHINTGIPIETVTKIWDEVVEHFGGYGFNKSLYCKDLVRIYTDNGYVDKAIEEVIQGDIVKSRDEKTKEDIFVKVKDKHDHGIQEVFEVTLNNGKIIKCTMNHKFRTTMGEMLPLREILQKDLSILNSPTPDIHFINEDGCNIASVKSIGKCQTYDLEIDHPDHQYYLSNGVLTSNSHATFYSFLGYITAYLKANFPMEFIIANIRSEVLSANKKVAEDNIAKLKEELRRLNISICKPDVNSSDISYSIVGENTVTTGLDSIKHTSEKSISEIIKHRPYSSFEDFMDKVDTSLVDVSTIRALIASGCFDSFGRTRKQMYMYAQDYKTKLQAHKKKKSKTKFVYPFQDIEEWTIPELYALERYYTGEGFSGTKFQVYPEFFTTTCKKFTDLNDILPYPINMTEAELKKYTVKVLNIQGVVKNVQEFKVKKEDSKIRGELMGRILLEDPFGNTINVTLFPDGLKKIKERVQDFLGSGKELEPEMGIFIHGELQWYADALSITYSELAKICFPPKLPVDMKEHKKIKMTKSKKIIIEDDDVESREDWLSEMEDDLITEGNYEDI